MKKFSLWAICLSLFFSYQSIAQTTIGDEFVVDVQPQHPYATTKSKGYVFEKEFYSKGSGFVNLHFKNFDLAPGDYVEVFSPKTGESYAFSEGGKVVNFDTRETISEFWTGAIWDDKVVVRLYSKGNSLNYGFEIDRVAYGYSEEKIQRLFEQSTGIAKTVCGADDREQIACYQGTEIYNKSRAVCRIIIGGRYTCTGWLVGSEGHVMTNQHCIENANDAQNTQFIFNFEYQNCNGTSATSQDVVANTSTLVKLSNNLDYSLVKLPVNPTNTYGYLSMSSQAPSTGDRIYIPQHPGGRRKEIAVFDSQSSGNVAQINNVGSKRIAYFADTQGGSSGSPVLDYNSNLVVVLHNTGSCSAGNGGNKITSIINDLGNLVPANGVDNNNSGGGGNPPGGGGNPPGGGGGPTGTGTCDDFGVSYVDDNTIMVYHRDLGWTANWHYICLDGYCVPGTLQDGYYYQTYSANLGQSYSIEFKAQDSNTSMGQYLSGVETVTFSTDQCSFTESLEVERVEQDGYSLSIYPNPSEQILHISSDTEQDVSYKILDQTGREVSTGSGNDIDINSLQPGIYFIKVKEKSFRFIKK